VQGSPTPIPQSLFSDQKTPKKVRQKYDKVTPSTKISHTSHTLSQDFKSFLLLSLEHLLFTFCSPSVSDEAPVLGKICKWNSGRSHQKSDKKMHFHKIPHKCQEAF
jgi:hypothetical protein